MKEIRITEDNVPLNDQTEKFARLVKHQPRSQGLSSSRPQELGGGKKRDPGNEVGKTPFAGGVNRGMQIRQFARF